MILHIPWYAARSAELGIT